MANEINKIMASGAIDDINIGVENGDFQLPCDGTILRAFCIWAITGILYEVSKESSPCQEIADAMTKTYLRILGVNDEKAEMLVKRCPSLKPLMNELSPNPSS